MKINLTEEQWVKLARPYLACHDDDCGCEICQDARELMEKVYHWYRSEQPETVKEHIIRILWFKLEDLREYIEQNPPEVPETSLRDLRASRYQEHLTSCVDDLQFYLDTSIM